MAALRKIYILPVGAIRQMSQVGETVGIIDFISICANSLALSTGIVLVMSCIP